MSGFGERFRIAGYTTPKPLIEIDGKPIIAHVIDLFPNEHNFLFICNREHIHRTEYKMVEILQKYCPTGKIAWIEPHKLGPVYAISLVSGMIDDDQEVVVNYCDFSCLWDWQHFKTFIMVGSFAGVIPAYKGFHPHSLGSTQYAYLRHANGIVSDIQEKQPYTDNRMEEFASSGTYYFSSGKIMKEAFLAVQEQQLHVGGEYYVSLAYKAILKDGGKVAIYPLQHFMQWGTPEDVAEYLSWSFVFRRLLLPAESAATRGGSLIIPMAGLGQRFAREGYITPKPLIAISGRAMVLQAISHLPPTENLVFVLRQNMPCHDEIIQAIKDEYPGAIIEVIMSSTEGQACSAIFGLEALERKFGHAFGPLTIGACDFASLYKQSILDALLDDLDTDIIIWAVRGHANAMRHPHMLGWVDVEGDRVKGISVKTPLASPSTDPIVLGTFTFRRASDFRAAVDHLIARDGRVNGEFYIDSCINDAISMGLKCRIFEVDSYISWGTPNDLRTFEYWQSCFHKWDGHPYRLEHDKCVPPHSVAELELRYKAIFPPLLEGDILI